MKKLMAIILTVTMLLSSLTVLTSFAEGETNALAEIITLPEGQTWTIEEGLKLGSVVYNDNSMTYWDFGGLALEGASYLQTTSAYAQTSHDNMCDSKEIAATVRVSKSCDVYVMTTCPYTNTQGMKDSNYMRWLLPDSIYSENSLKYGYEPVYDSEGNHVIVTTSSSRTLYPFSNLVISCLIMGQEFFCSPEESR